MAAVTLVVITRADVLPELLTKSIVLDALKKDVK